MAPPAVPPASLPGTAERSWERSTGYPSPRSHPVRAFPHCKLHRARVSSPLSLSRSRSTAKRCKEKHLEEALQLTRALSEGLRALGEAEARPLLRCVLAFQMEATSSSSSFQKLEQVRKAIGWAGFAHSWHSSRAFWRPYWRRGSEVLQAPTVALGSWCLPGVWAEQLTWGVSWQMVTQLAVGKEALLAQEVDTLLSGLALQGEVREP